MKIDLTPEQLSRLLHYDKDAGGLTWLVAGNGRIRGARAGNYGRSGGEVSLSINGKFYKAHNIVWLIMTGRPRRSRSNSAMAINPICALITYQFLHAA